jgi:hypothetical protein
MTIMDLKVGLSAYCAASEIPRYSVPAGISESINAGIMLEPRNVKNKNSPTEVKKTMAELLSS